MMADVNPLVTMIQLFENLEILLISNIWLFLSFNNLHVCSSGAEPENWDFFLKIEILAHTSLSDILPFSYQNICCVLYISSEFN